MKKILIGLLAIIVLVVGGLFVFILNFDANQYKPEIIELVKSSTGRDFRIEGDLSIEHSLIPTLVAEGVYFGNAAWASDKDMLKVEHFSAVAELIPLLSNQLSIRRVDLQKAELFLEKNAEGQANWELELSEQETGEASGDAPSFAISSLKLSDITVHYREAGKDDKVFKLQQLNLKGRAGSDKLKLDMAMQALDMPVSLEGTVSEPGQWKDNQAFSIDLRAKLAELSASITGQVNRPQDLTGISFKLTAQGNSTGPLTRLAGIELPDPGAFEVQLDIADTGEAWTAEKIGLKLDLDARLADMNLQANGHINHLQALQGVSLDVDFRADSLQVINTLAGTALPEVGAVALRGKVEDLPKSGDATLPGVKLDIQAEAVETRLAIVGSIQQAQILKGVDVKISADGDSLAGIGKLAGKTLTDSSPFKLVFNIKDLGAGLLNENSGLLLDGGGRIAALDLQTKGRVGQLRAAKDVDLQLSVAGDSTREINGLLEQDIQVVGPVAFNGQVIEKAGVWQTRDMSLKVGRSDIAGQLQVNMKGKVPDATGQIKSSVIDLTEFLPPPEEVEENKPAAERVFPSEPLPRELLKQLNLVLALDAALLKTYQTDIKNLHVDVTLKDGELRLKKLHSDILGGKLRATASLSASRPDVDMDLKLTGIQPTQLPEIKQSKELEGAVTDLDLKLTGKGQSIAEIAASANGNLKLRVGEGKINNKGINLAGGDLILGSLSALNPLASKDPSTKLECAAVNFVIKDGIASNDKAFALQTAKVNVLGGGNIDLKTEKIDISAKPKPREGIGINLSGMAGVVKLGGTLANPTPEADAVGVAKTAAKVGAALATGGLSIIAEGLFDRATVDDTICQVVLGEKPTAKTTSSTAKKSSSSQKTEDNTTSSNPVESVGNAVKGLFGQ